MIKPKFDLRNNPAYKEGSILGSTDVGTKIAPVPLTFTRVSKGYVEKASGLTEMGSNLPRIDKDGNTLYEPQRTNLLTYSQDFSNASWIKANATVSSNTTVAPDGKMTADELNEDSSTNSHFITQTGVSLPNAVVNITAFAKSKGDSRYLIVATNGGGINNAYGVFDLDNGSITETGAGLVSATIEPSVDGWYRCKIVYDNTGTSITGALYSLSQSATPGTRITSYLGDGTSGVYIWQAQLEQGSYATSPIKTEGSKVTRVADTSSTTGLSNIFGDSEGTIFFDGSKLNSVSAQDISFSDGTTSNNILLQFSSSSSIKFFVTVGGVNQVGLEGGSYSANERKKIILRYKQNDFSLWVDGVNVASSTSGSTFPDGTLSKISFSRADDVTRFFNGNVNELTIFDVALTDEEITELNNLTTL